MVFSIDPNVKGAISESFDKSHLSQSVDVPAGCSMCFLFFQVNLILVLFPAHRQQVQRLLLMVCFSNDSFTLSDTDTDTDGDTDTKSDHFPYFFLPE